MNGVDAPVTFRALVAAFTDFLTVATHTILYERSIYPRTSFLTTRKYNYAVRQNRHPKVCDWINDAVIALEAQLLKSAVERVAIVIYNKTNEPLERFMFDVSLFPVVPETDIDVPLGRDEVEDAQLLPLVDMEEQFRAVMSRLSNCSTSLQAIPSGCTFTIAIELRQQDHHAPVSHPQAWIPVVPNTTPTSSTTSGHTSKAIPLRAMSAGELTFDCWIEESKLKLSHTSATVSQSDNS